MLMKTALSCIAFLSAVALLISAYSERIIAAKIGQHGTPEIKILANDSVNVSLDNLRGRYVLVNFWDSTNAVSRIAAGEYDRFLHRNTHRPFELVSVNTDADRTLFHEIIKKDDLDSSTQFHISDSRSKRTAARYRVDDGFSSYLLDPQGKIVAINPTIETLERFLSNP